MFAVAEIDEAPAMVTGLAYSTTYYVFYDDSDLVGGAVSYQYSTTKADALNGAGRFFVGSVLTPPASGTDTIGNNDGGTGAQFGIHGNSWGTLETFSGITGVFINPQNAIDGNTSTYADIAGSTGISRMIVSGFNGINPVYSSVVLNVRTQITTPMGITLTVDYSLDGGSTFTTIYSTSAGRALTTDTVALSTTQSLALVQVRFTWGSAGTPGGQWNIYGAWVALTN